MERDFMGLRHNNNNVKQEQPDDQVSNSSSVPMRRSGLHWSFTNNGDASSQVLSFKSNQERGGLAKPYSSNLSQRNLSLDNQGGSHHAGSGYHWQHNDTLPINNAHGQTNTMIPSTLNSSIISSHMSQNGPNVVGSSISGAGAVPSSNSPVVGSTDLRNSSSISTGPCQLTIFYNGSVCVYDNVSSERAQAIMLLAGNGDSTSVPAPPKLQHQVLKAPTIETAITNQHLGFSSSMSLPPPAPRPLMNDIATLNNSFGFSSSLSLASQMPKPTINETLLQNKSLGFSSSISLASPLLKRLSSETSKSNQSLGFSRSICTPSPVLKSPPTEPVLLNQSLTFSRSLSTPVTAVASSSASEATPVKPAISPVDVKRSETPRPSNPPATNGAKATPAAVPQARRASLARFLEKRKERVIGASPYVASKNNSECSAAGPGGSTAATNSASSTPIPASN